MSKKPWPQQVLITGANRGLGLGLAAAYLSRGATVYCCARHPDGARELWELQRDYPQRCQVLTLDVTSSADLAALAERAKTLKLDLLINNAGVMTGPTEDLAKLKAESLAAAYAVNVIGPALVTQALQPALGRGTRPACILISSIMGSIGLSDGGYYAYRCSKAALNMLGKSLSRDLKGVLVAMMHPGWVKTAMGGESAPTSIDDSVAGMVRVIQELEAKDNGRFVDFQGKTLSF